MNRPEHARRNRSLGIVVSTGEDDDFATAVAIALAARERNIEVSMFFMADAVARLPSAHEAVAALLAEDCELIACAQSAHERGLGEPAVGMLLGSQDDHAALAHRCDRLLAFT